jgi:hypothetical protein
VSKITMIVFSAIFPVVTATVAGTQGGAMISASRFADSPGVFAGIIEIAVAGFCLVKGMAMLRRRLLRWHQETQEIATVQPTGHRDAGREERRKPQMRPQFLTRPRRRGIAAALAVIGVSLWLGAVLLHVSPTDGRDVTFPHLEARLLGIVAGGASVAGGIVLLVAV